MLKISGPVDAMPANFKISSAKQKRPHNFHDALLPANFKTAFMLFLLAEGELCENDERLYYFCWN